MSPRRQRKSGGPGKGTTAMNTPSQAKLDALDALSKWLRVRRALSCARARHYVLFAAFGHEADQLAMRQLAVFLETLKGVQQ